MTNRMQISSREGKEVLFLDYTGFTPDDKQEFYALLDEAKAFILTRKKIFLIVDTNDSFADNEMINRMKQDAKEEKDIIEKEAILGISGIKGVFVQVISLFSGITIRTFNTKEEAMNWFF